MAMQLHFCVYSLLKVYFTRDDITYIFNFRLIIWDQPLFGKHATLETLYIFVQVRNQVIPNQIVWLGSSIQLKKNYMLMK